MSKTAAWVLASPRRCPKLAERNWTSSPASPALVLQLYVPRVNANAGGCSPSTEHGGAG